MSKFYLALLCAVALIAYATSADTPDLAPPLTVTEPIVITVAPEPETPQPILDGELTANQIVQIYTEHEDAVAAIWVSDESFTMRDAVLRFLSQHPESDPRNNPTIFDAPKPKPKPQPAAKPTIKDGQLSPRGEWRWSAKAWAWQPVKKAGPQYNTKPRGNVAYVEPNTRAAYLLHLSQDHGFDRMWLQTQNAEQLFALHSDAHYGLVDSSRVKWAGNCPNGQCARPSTVPAYQSRGIFRRR